MQSLLGLSRRIDRLLGFFASIGGWLGFALVLVVCYDVTTRYFGVQKPAGLNSTMIQEFEYWLHSGLIVFALGYAYVRNAHVRIDLLRENFSNKTKHLIEAIGISFALIPYSVIGLWLSWPFVKQSFISGEISKSQTGLSNLWIVKAGLLALFLLLLLAGLSQLIKAVAGYLGKLSAEQETNLFGGGH
ncbi:Tripartite ATP-independent periplasmic transporter, DctQ component [Shimia sp. SK013]|uniref:TRAP transporter small permease subunit n=1 Tax=Shimia sp. SK013 TaxID=1389006 RepID=UPI0006CE1211|nr:TRAP transporter small permease subunit [Shimia sp. SK013]KPA20676.1 Tripartite ATP-independent periplasmic transporter, DctQ component [Shimia sp. SK013]